MTGIMLHNSLHVSPCNDLSSIGLGDSTTVVHCHDSWSTIVMIVLTYYCDSGRYNILMNYRVYFMLPMFSLLELFVH